MHLLSTSQIKSRFALEKLLDVVDLMRSPWQRNIDLHYQARSKVLGIVKDEPSTRTRVSFEVAMKRLGGEVVSVELHDSSSSAMKGESLEDTIKTLSEYVDVIAVRCREELAVDRAARLAKVPIINAGDGSGEHPTQALLDLYTIRKECGRLDRLKIIFVGDLKNSRCIHSLVYLLGLLNDIEIFLVAPPNLDLPREQYNHLVKHNVKLSVYGCLKDAVIAADGRDIIYMTRLQKERFEDDRDLETAEKQYSQYYLTHDIIGMLSPQASVLHPLPRCGEIPTEFDIDPRAAYFKQVANGMYLRMALLYNQFEKGSLY